MKNIKILWLDFLVRVKATKKLKRAIKRNICRKNDTDMFKSKHAPLIVSIYSEKKFLSDKALKQVLTLPNAKEILEKYVTKPHRELPIPVETQLFNSPDMTSVLKNYIANQHISDTAKSKIFEHANATELILLYIQSNTPTFNTDDEIKMVKLGNVKIISTFAQKHKLSHLAQLKMLEHPNGINMCYEYAQHAPLCDTVQSILFLKLQSYEALQWLKTNTDKLCDEAINNLLKMSNSVELIFQYIKNHRLTPTIESILFKQPNPEEIFRCYILHTPLHSVNEHLLLTLTKDVEAIQRYIENYGISAETVDTIFASPMVETLLLSVVKTQKLQEQQELKLFKQPTAKELLLTYIQKNELSAKAQLQLLKMPKKLAEPIMREYAEKYEFSKAFLQLMMVDSYLLQWIY